MTCSNFVINELGGSPIKLENVYFANSEQAPLVFFITRSEHNLIKLKLYKGLVTHNDILKIYRTITIKKYF